MTFSWNDEGAPVAPSGRPEEIFPRESGPFRLLSKLGQGGMGVVYAAEVIETGQRVALKLLLDLRKLEPSHVERFRREGELAARLTHPGIVRVHSAGELNGDPYLACELVLEARSLDEACCGLELKEKLVLLRQVVAAVAAAHEQGIVHRDLKPQNVLVDREGRVRVCDFGLATAGDLSRLTKSEAFLGTPTHMSPEQLEGGSHEASRATTVDVWALGVLLYEAVAERRVFEAATVLETIAQVSSARIRPPSAYAKSSPEIDAVILRALERDLGRRYPTARELLADLDALLDERPPDALRGERVRQVRFALIGFLIVLTLVSLAGWGVSRTRAARRARLLSDARSQLQTVELRPSLRGEIERLREIDLVLRELGDQGQLRDRISVRLGLALLAHGQPAEAQALLSVVPDAPEAPLLRAACALEEGQLPSEADGRALAATPLRFRELLTWQAAQTLATDWNPALARRALPTLKRAGPPGRRWRVILLARLGRAAESDLLLGKLAAAGEPPPGTEEACALSANASGYATLNPDALNAASKRLPRAGVPLLASWRRELACELAKGSGATMRELLDLETDQSADRRLIEACRARLLAILSGLVRLAAGVTTEEAIASQFTTASVMVGAPPKEFVDLLSSAHPDYTEVQVPLLALRMAGVPSRKRCGEALPIAERAAACTKGIRRFVVGALLAHARWKLGHCELALADLQLLIDEAPGRKQALLRFQRARCLRGLGRYEEALADLRWILAQPHVLQVDTTLARFERGQILNFLKRGDAARADFAAFLREADGIHGSSLYKLAAKVLWTHDRNAHADDLASFGRLVARAADPAFRVWDVRLALLEAEAGDSAGAARRLRTAARFLSIGGVTFRRVARRSLEIAAELDRGGGPAPFREWVKTLDEAELGFAPAWTEMGGPFVTPR
ncbi:MAG: serine/threonine protein kinase [Planctomycetes bacterium]|nr:serine/threonine protein kinase [Planctomycetota bacterium]